MDNGLYKLITLRTSSTGTPEKTFAGVNQTIAEILGEKSINMDKNDVTVNGQSVEGSYIPSSGDEVIIQPKKYSSGGSIK